MSDPRAEAGDFERAALPHLDAVYSLARLVMRDEHDAQDAVQDAFLRALRYYDPITVRDVRAWLLTIVRHCCFTALGRRQPEGEVVSADAELLAIPDPRPGPDASASAAAARDAIAAALDALPAEYREVIVLREMEQLSYREIAQVTGVPIGTVMSRLSRARRRLQQALGENFEAAG